MKPITSALVGAAIVGGSSIGLHAVAFAGEAAVAPSPIAAENSAGRAVVLQAGEEAGTCQADAHGHASSCTCARCSAATAE